MDEREISGQIRVGPLERDRGGYQVPESLLEGAKRRREHEAELLGERERMYDGYQPRAEILRLKAEVVALREACWQLWDTACPVMTGHGFKWPVPTILQPPVEKNLDTHRVGGAESRAT